MRRIINLFITVLFGCLLLSDLVFAANPQWQANSPQFNRSVPGTTDTNVPSRFDLQCPTAYAGLKGELLPTYWEPADKGQPVQLIKSQVQGQSLYCVYRLNLNGRSMNSSVRRLVPRGVSCITDGVGRFECNQ